MTGPTFTLNKWPPNQGLPPCMLHIKRTASTARSTTGIVFAITMHQSISTGTAGTGMTITEATTSDHDTPDAIKVLEKEYYHCQNQIIFSLEKAMTAYEWPVLHSLKLHTHLVKLKWNSLEVAHLCILRTFKKSFYCSLT